VRDYSPPLSSTPETCYIAFDDYCRTEPSMSYKDIITIEPGKRGGKPCIRGLRITVYDVLEYLASGMTHEQILKEFPYLTAADIQACLEYAADRERHQLAASV
jgi:uncharacterized protein (DUF433 family)